MATTRRSVTVEAPTAQEAIDAAKAIMHRRGLRLSTIARVDEHPHIPGRYSVTLVTREP